MDGKKILVIGSANTDMVIQTDKFPSPGETVLGGKFFTNQGGKGANQAVAAKRLGGDVTFICKLGNDSFGTQSFKLLQEEGLCVDHLIIDPEHASGVASIIVNESGENTIVVAPGANGALTDVDFRDLSLSIDEYEIVLLQLEIPVKTVEYLAGVFAKNNKRVILNPAPAVMLHDDIYPSLSIITPNETEASLLTGFKVTNESSANTAAKWFVEKGVKNVVITMGSSGAYVYSQEFIGMVHTDKVKAVDTTAAGDTFNGALAVSLSEGNAMQDAVRFACKAATIAVTRQGAQTSIPIREEIN